MSNITFRAMQPADFFDNGSSIPAFTSGDICNVINSVDDIYEDDDTVHSLASCHQRKWFKLALPTFNCVLGQSRCVLLGKMLGLKQDIWNKIFDYNVVVDPADIHEFIPVDDAIEGKQYLYGASIAEALIGDFNIQDAIVSCIKGAIYYNLKQNCDDVDSFIQLKQSKTELPGYHHIGADWWMYYEAADLKRNIKGGHSIHAFTDDVKEVLFSSNESRFTFLMNMNPDKSALYGMLNYYIMIVPKAMRPPMDKREHRLTKLYAAAIKKNYELRKNVDSTAVKQFRNLYLGLDRAIQNLQYKNMTIGHTPDDLSIMERVKTKQGQIRKCNLGKRQDYSGRAVVCINPYLPLDVIRVPQYMLPKLLEYHILPFLAEKIMHASDSEKEQFSKLSLNNLSSPDMRAEMINIINEHNLLAKVPIIMGRQPTLHKQSLQGFHIEMTPINAIEVNPLVCPAFNMDFDGDQAHLEVPLSPEAVNEVNDLVMTTQNLFLPKTGECTTEPRQDMMYGLWMCTQDKYVEEKHPQLNIPFSNCKAVKDMIFKNKIKIWDRVYVSDMNTSMMAGDAAFISCFPTGEVTPRGTTITAHSIPVQQIGKGTISQYIDLILRVSSSGSFLHRLGTGYASTETVVGCINALVELGFKVARLYPPNMSLIQDRVDDPAYSTSILNFHKNMSQIDEYYNLGLETSDNYQRMFEKNLTKLNKVREDGIMNVLGDDNGYVRLSKSGARGSKSNLVQAFSIKGQVKKNETESFNALLESSYASQLSPMEHFVAAYGGRQGQIDKSLKTGDTGYAMRQMWHATQGITITCDDCGTTEGIKISKSDLMLFSDKDGEEAKNDVKQIFSHALVGRYLVNSNNIITDEAAKRMADDDNIDTVVMRSPLKCKNPCCAKCYGIEWSTHRKAIVGTPVGIIAAQSIGEPGTQLTLKQFQKGGVAGKAEVTSAFDKVNAYIHIQDLAAASKNGRYSGYDPIAWATGDVETTLSTHLGYKYVYIREESGNRNRNKIEMPIGVVLKQHAVKGEGLSARHGDYDISEILQYSGTSDRSAIDAAQFYLAFKLFALYRSEIQIKMVHFEILVSSMTRYMITSTDRDDLMVGQYATRSELLRGSLNNTEYIPRILGVKKLPNASHDALDAIIMESQVEGLSRVCLLGMHDRLVKPLNRMVMGQTILQGSATKNYTEKRYISI